MPADDSAAILVARFLRGNNYSLTLEAFLEEAGLPDDAGALTSGSLTVEQILQEKKTFDLSVNFEKLGTEENAGWSIPAPTTSKPVPLPTSVNVLQSSVEILTLSASTSPTNFIVATTADRRLTISACDDDFVEVSSVVDVQDSPILSYTILHYRFVVSTAMSGRLAIYDLWDRQQIASRKDHVKYAVKTATKQLDSGSSLLATAGWDSRVFIYSIDFADNDLPQLQDPIASIQVPSNPEDIIFIEDPISHQLYLLLSRRDSTLLHYYNLSDQLLGSSGTAVSQVQLQLSGTQNLAPQANSWVSFTPAAFAICPTDPTLLAVATSSVPHMKIIIVRLLFPSEPDLPPAIGSATQTSSGIINTLLRGHEESALLPSIVQAREALTQQTRETAAIQIQCSTMATQTPYSTPALTWRPDGTGVWVNSDDGLIRGIEASTGKIVASLKSHEPGSKIRCVSASMVASPRTHEEWLISGGFDQKLFVWRPTLKVEEEG